MKRALLEPDGWPCKLSECRPGAFIFGGEHIGFRSDYRGGEVFNSSGEFLCIPADEEVQPVEIKWEAYDECI